MIIILGRPMIPVLGREQAASGDPGQETGNIRIRSYVPGGDDVSRNLPIDKPVVAVTSVDGPPRITKRGGS